ncbi:MAG TPA: hypothetical protein VJ910_08570 [Desulfuromonadales bacterium]|nr:hypothetical protein [Desulfuromonadales bacterium]
MKKTTSEHELRQEFVDFIETKPVSPGKHVDQAILAKVRNDLQPALWRVYGKFTLVQAAAGFATLAVCPQFGLGFGQHEFLHALHSTTPSAIYYFLCGLFFVVLGAALAGLILSREEIRAVYNSKYVYFFGYSVLAYLIFVALGAEAFVVSSLVWIVGALLGNILGFGTIVRLREAFG